jgi:hypothetical protein
MLKVPRLTIAYIVLLGVLGVLLDITFVHPLVNGQEYSAVQNESLSKTDQGWTLDFTLVNPFPKETAFEIMVGLDSQQLTQDDVTIPSGHSFDFAMPVDADQVKQSSKLLVGIYKEHSSTPFEQETLYLTNANYSEKSPTKRSAS